jgi:hypothetical protein
MEGVAILETEVRELIRRRGIDPVRDRRGIQDLVADALADYDGRSVIGAVPPLTDPLAALKSIVDAVAGLGPLQRYLDDPEVEEIWINSPQSSIRAGESVTGPPQSAQSPQERPRRVRPQPCGSGPRHSATSASRC